VFLRYDNLYGSWFAFITECDLIIQIWKGFLLLKVTMLQAFVNIDQ